MKQSLNWYKSLSIHQRINLKEVCSLLTGCTWEFLSYFLNMKEKIEVLYNKLKMEGFEV